MTTKDTSLSFCVLSCLYQGAWRLARPFLRCNRRLRDGWDERLAPEGWVPPFSGVTLWIQAASGGEAYLLVNIARELLETWDASAAKERLRILATVCTRQGMDVLKRFQEQGEWQKGEFLPRFLPLDEPRLMERAISQAHPCQIILLETELWPGLLGAARQAGVPVLLLNGRLTPKSLSGYQKLPDSFWAGLAPERILAVSEADAQRFARLFGSERTGIMSNIKFDLIPAVRDAAPGGQPVSAGQAEALEKGQSCPIGPGGSGQDKAFTSAPLILFASVRKQEAKQVAAAIRLFKEMRPHCVLVLAPRHLHHADLWRLTMQRNGLESVLRSELPAPDGAAPAQVLEVCSAKDRVLIWDRFGELKQLYAEAAAAYVGGSLAPLGGQNFMEALAVGLRPCVGPYIDNFLWVGDSILEMLHHAPDAPALALALAGELDNPQPKSRLREEFFQRVQSRQGGTRQAVEAILAGLDAVLAQR